jgi:cytochrome bd-type quinol oxidase subunit 2
LDPSLEQSAVMTPFITAGAGFLMAVLWCDLMFDVQVRRHRSEAEVPSDVVDSIATYYARVTTAARPMNRLIAFVMVATTAALVAQVARGEDPRWTAWATLALTVGAVLLAGIHTVPTAIRLGTRRDPPAERSELARAVFRDHVACFAAIAAVLVLQLGR